MTSSFYVTFGQFEDDDHAIDEDHEHDDPNDEKYDEYNDAFDAHFQQDEGFVTSLMTEGHMRAALEVEDVY